MNIRRVYETTVIINIVMGEQEVEAVVEKITNYIKNRGGEIEETNK
jgi:ribosomal protein S6